MAKAKLYVGCSLTQASEEFKSEIDQLKRTLRDSGFEVFDFVGLVNGTAEEVYKWDIGHCVGECDAFIGICDYPSIGLGWELGEAIRLGKPSFAVAHKDSKITRMVLGAAEVEPNLKFERYTDLLRDVPSLVSHLL
jgi:nucleoside 2-deoxyribosyltransferase